MGGFPYAVVLINVSMLIKGHEICLNIGKCVSSFQHHFCHTMIYGPVHVLHKERKH